VFQATHQSPPPLLLAAHSSIVLTTPSQHRLRSLPAPPPATETSHLLRLQEWFKSHQMSTTEQEERQWHSYTDPNTTPLFETAQSTRRRLRRNPQAQTPLPPTWSPSSDFEAQMTSHHPKRHAEDGILANLGIVHWNPGTPHY
jgi:hypothetical protein